MVNKVRGETKIVLDQEYALSLGLGVLAELEDALGVENFEEALDFSKPSAKRLRTFMIAVLTGNDIALTDELRAAVNRLSVPDFMDFLTALMAASGMVDAAEPAKEGTRAPLAAKRAGKRG